MSAQETRVIIESPATCLIRPGPGLSIDRSHAVIEGDIFNPHAHHRRPDTRLCRAPHARRLEKVGFGCPVKSVECWLQDLASDPDLRSTEVLRVVGDWFCS